MAISYNFDSKFEVIGKFAEDVLDVELKNEPMFFNSDLTFAYAKGGSATRAFIDALPHDWQIAKTIFDSRVHMLMPGWLPAIPGFHHDDVPRPIIPVGKHFGTAGQPDYDAPRYHSEHIMGLINGGVAPTEFAVGRCVMPKVPAEEVIYRRWHLEVERLASEGTLLLKSVPDRRLIAFDCHAFHQATKAQSSGWRWFARVSRNTERVETPSNEIRRQVQVYLSNPMQGW